MKRQCEEQLVTKLQGRFLAQTLMNAFGIVYPQQWLQLESETRFVVHLAILKDALCQPKKLGLDELLDLGLFLATAFDLQRSLFVITMKNNSKLVMQKPFDVKPLTKLWITLFSSQILVNKIPKYIKLPFVSMIHAFWNMEIPKPSTNPVFGLLEFGFVFMMN